jgi:hypothetical protein
MDMILCGSAMSLRQASPCGVDDGVVVFEDPI